MPQTTDFMMAMMLLTGVCVEPDYTNFNTKEVRAALSQRCIKLQYMDERESRYVLTRQEDFENDVRMLQNRYRMLKDAPMVEEADWRLPMPREELNKAIQFNRAFLVNMEAERLWNPDRAAIYDATIKENQFLYKVYDAARDAKCDFYYVTVRRTALVELRRLLRVWDGDDKDETYRGLRHFPPCAPIWRFRERR
jgi:hypothetical protein